MNRIEMNRRRINNLMQAIIIDYDIDLKGMTILTECASNVFAVTPLIAALAGADRVIAYAKDTKYGLAKDNIEFLYMWADELGIQDKIYATVEPPHMFAAESNIVTNLNLLRPIGKDIIDQMPTDSCIPLMWEPWEFRDEDLDLNLCNKRGVPVLGTNETNPRLNIFRYVGLTAAKLLFELNIEVFKSKIVVVGCTFFTKEAEIVLSALDAEVIIFGPEDYKNLNGASVKSAIEGADAIVVLEMSSKETIIGGEKGIPVEWLVDNSLAVAHICGAIDDDAMKLAGIKKHPSIEVPPGYMTVTTAYMGPRAVVDLHAAGLKVGELVVNGLRDGLTVEEAKKTAVKSGTALDF